MEIFAIVVFVVAFVVVEMFVAVVESVVVQLRTVPKYHGGQNWYYLLFQKSYCN